jgi:hypothetical protein
MDKAKIEEKLDKFITVKEKVEELHAEFFSLQLDLKPIFSSSPELEFIYKKHRFFLNQDSGRIQVDLLPSFDEIFPFENT